MDALVSDLYRQEQPVAKLVDSKSCCFFGAMPLLE